MTFEILLDPSIVMITIYMYTQFSDLCQGEEKKIV